MLPPVTPAPPDPLPCPIFPRQVTWARIVRRRDTKSMGGRVAEHAIPNIIELQGELRFGGAPWPRGRRPPPKRYRKNIIYTPNPSLAVWRPRLLPRTGVGLCGHLDDQEQGTHRFAICDESQGTEGRKKYPQSEEKAPFYRPFWILRQQRLFNPAKGRQREAVGPCHE